MNRAIEQILILLIRLACLSMKPTRAIASDPKTIKRINEAAHHLGMAIEWLNGTRQSVYWQDPLPDWLAVPT